LKYKKDFTIRKMFVGTIKIELLIPGCKSLKDKRNIINSIKNRIKTKYNVSIVEVDFYEKWQRAAIGVSFVNGEAKSTEILCQKILDLFFDNNDFIVLNNKNSIISIED